jgi:hypothetical protein
MKYRRVTPTRWHHFVVWAIQMVTGGMVARDETSMDIERYLRRGKLMRRAAFRECAESRREMRRGE